MMNPLNHPPSTFQGNIPSQNPLASPISLSGLSGTMNQINPPSEKEIANIYMLVLALTDPDKRETALLELR